MSQESAQVVTESPLAVNLSEKDIARFWSKVEKLGTEAGCWIWTKSGKYGRLYAQRQRLKVHRISWMIHRGADPGIMLVCHHCDTPSCVNPEHLFVGTVADNNDDKMKKGRHVSISGDLHPNRMRPERMPRGSANSNAKLTDAKVIDIRIRNAAGVSQRQLALGHGVSQMTISRVITRRTWNHV